MRERRASASARTGARVCGGTREKAVEVSCSVAVMSVSDVSSVVVVVWAGKHQ
jgi:hypothetical protein